MGAMTARLVVFRRATPANTGLGAPNLQRRALGLARAAIISGAQQGSAGTSDLFNRKTGHAGFCVKRDF